MELTAARRGISLLDLFDLPAGSQALLPDEIASQFEGLAVINYSSTTSQEAYIHHGTIQSIGEGFALPGIRDWEVEIPGVNTGLPFQLTMRRIRQSAPDASHALEPQASDFQLDLLLNRIAITIPGLRPAIVQSTPGAPTRLVPDRTRDKVRIVGGAILRIKSMEGNVALQFIDAPDPFDLDMPVGALFGLTFDPPSFFIGDSEFGLTVNQLLYDASTHYTPGPILERGQPPEWTGLSIRDATVYMPPSVGHLSVGVRDLLLGSPVGLQGKIIVEFGRLSMEAIDVHFEKIGEAEEGDRTLTPSGSGQLRSVEIDEPNARIRGIAAVPDWPGDEDRPEGQTYNGFWILPDPPTEAGGGWNTEQQVLETSEFTVRPGDVVRFQGREKRGDEIIHQYPELVFTFERAGDEGGPGAEGDGRPAHAPHINLIYQAGSPAEQRFDDVLHISGAADLLRDMTFEAADVTGDAATPLRWQLQTGLNRMNLASGVASVAPHLPSAPGEHFLILKNSQNGGERRVLIEVREEGALLIGIAAGVREPDGDPVTPTATGSLYALDVFHRTGNRSTVSGERPALSGATVTVPENRIAEATVGDPGNPPTPTDPSERPQVTGPRYQIDGFETQQTTIPGGASTLNTVVRDLATDNTYAIIVGRTDDRWRTAADYDQRRRNNEDLARRRASAVYNALIQRLPGDSDISNRVFWRAEQDPTDSWQNGTPPPGVRDVLPGEARENGWLICTSGILPTDCRDGSVYNPPNHPLESTAPRPDFRRVDIYIVDPRGATGPEPSPSSPNHRQMLVPGPDAETRPPTPPQDTAQADPGGYRFRLIVEWDSPTLIALEDAIPTMAEVLIEWEGDHITLPARTDARSVSLTRDGEHIREVYAILGRWSYDARSGETLFSLSIRSVNDPNGLFSPIESNGLAVAFGLGPALISALDPEPGVGFVTFAALVVGAEFLTASRIVQFREGKVAILAITGEQRFANQTPETPGTRTRLTIDYTVEVGISVGLPPFSDTPDLQLQTKNDKPLKLKYKNVGIELVWADDGGVESFNGVFEGTDLEITDPGSWELAGSGDMANLMGNLLRVQRVNSGTKSIWFDLHLEFGLDLGIISITGAVVRVIFPQAGGGEVSVELRGLGLKIDIPETLKGEGMLALTPNGGFSARIAMQVIPANVEATGAIRIIPVPASATGDGYTHTLVELGLILPAGIPLGGSGMALYGFVGRFVANGWRSLPDNPDPIEQEIEWHTRTLNTQKYEPQQGEWAIGLGAVVGTMPDTGYSFNALGMFTVSFPTVSVVFSIDAKFASPPSVATEGPEEDEEVEENGVDISLKLLGLVAINSEAVKLGIRGTFKIEKVLELYIPISAFFPINRQPETPDAYLRIGSDGVNPANFDPPGGGFERFGDPVTLTLLPDSLNVEAWAFNMFEHKRLAYLGGEQDLGVLTGFSIGFGAGFTIDWSAGPIRLYATAKVLLGMGTKPLMLVGGIFVRGGLSLVILSIEISGKLLFRVWVEEQWLIGEFCGAVSFLFFSIEGCVGVEIGSGAGIEIPDPEPLCPKLDLTDRRGVTTGTAQLPTRETPTPDIPVVWIDTIPVVQFQHNVTGTRNDAGKLILDADSNFEPVNDPHLEPLWSGTSELKYSYYLTGVELWKHNGTDWEQETDSHPASWWWPWHRPGLIAEEDATTDGPPTPSEHEGRQLALLTWNPQPLNRVQINGGAGTDGDPARTVGRICEPAPALNPVCALGKNARRRGYDRVVLRPDGPGSAPYFDTFDVFAHERLGGHSTEAIAMLVDGLGLYLRPGAVVPISHPLARGGAYRITSVNRYGRLFTTMRFEARYAPRVVNPNLTLALGVSRLEVPDEPILSCDDFENISDFEPDTSFAHGNWLYQADSPLSLETSPASGRQGILAKSQLLISRSEGCRAVQLTLEAMGSERTMLDIVAYDPNGQLVASQTVVLTATAIDVELGGLSMIQRLELRSPEEMSFLLTKICCGQIPEPENVDQNDLPELFHDDVLSGAYNDIFPDPEGAYPRVLGILPTGSTVEWPPAELGSDSEYTFVEYTAPDRGPWLGFRIEPWRQQPVYVVSSCANTQRASDHHDNEADQRNNLLIVFPLPLFDTHPLLEPDSLYQVRVRYHWIGWKKGEESDTPPEAWEPEVEETRPGQGSDSATFTFRTAPFRADLPDNPPVNLLDESTFDPRGTIRYFAGFEVHSRFHFYEDPVYAHVKVKYLERLYEEYDYDLQWVIRRTDMPAGSRSPSLDPAELMPLEVPLTQRWDPLAPELLEVGDRRIREAAADTDCLGQIPIGGTTGTLNAELGPRHQYDVLLLAIPPGNGAELVVARTHFATSRYPNPQALLEALGFGPPNAPAYRHPLDLVVPGTLPPDGGALGNDADLEAALTGLGLDPFPLADTPRTVLLWSREEAVYTLIGVLLEIDEPLYRTLPMQNLVRLQVVETSVVGGGSNIRFTPRFSNGSFTRMILTPEAESLEDLTHLNLQSLADLTLRLTLGQQDRASPAGPVSDPQHTGSVSISGAPLAILEGE